MKKQTIFLGADHRGFYLKGKIKKWLSKNKIYNIQDLGNTKYQKNDDYPEYGAKVAKAVAVGKGKNSKGILFCGNGQGICIVANKIRGIRAVAISTTKNAKLTREHNDANILCLSGNDLSTRKTKKLIKVFLTTKFSGALRHKRRLKKIKLLERG